MVSGTFAVLNPPYNICMLFKLKKYICTAVITMYVHMYVYSLHSFSMDSLSIICMLYCSLISSLPIALEKTKNEHKCKPGL